jgi:hypothetical protein
MRKEISDQMAAAARNDTSPILGIGFEFLALEGVYLVADNAGDGHVRSMAFAAHGHFV